MNQLLEKYHLQQINREQNFSLGDKVRVHYKIIEGNKERIQKYEGTVIAIQNEGVGKSITVYRVSHDVGVERIFPLYTPTIEKIEKLRSNKVRRAKLYYLKDKTGKEGRLKEIKKEPKTDHIYEKAQKFQQSQPPQQEAAAAVKDEAPEVQKEEPKAVKDNPA